MRILITGGAGFVGSNLVERLLNQKKVKKDEIIIYDNLYLGKWRYIQKFIGCRNFKFIKADLLNFKRLNKAMKGINLVFHLAANSDIRKGTRQTDLDLNLNTIATYNVLEAMRQNKVKNLIFTSTSAVCGEANGGLDEDYGPCRPISLYGASKLACEALISAYSNNFGIKAIIFRFANIVGKNSTHGVLYDFISQLKRHPKRLLFLANGRQRKPYLEVKDLIEGMLTVNYILQSAPADVYTFNIGPEDTISVSDIGDIVINKMGLKSKKIFTDKKRGWIGDVITYKFDTSKIQSLGWQPRYDSKQAIEKAMEDLCRQ